MRKQNTFDFAKNSSFAMKYHHLGSFLKMIVYEYLQKQENSGFFRLRRIRPKNLAEFIR